VLEKFCIPESKIVAITTDGAAVMVGRKTGVNTRLKSHYPYLISIHCHAHKLALCISQAADNVDIFADMQRTLIQIYQWFSSSSLRQANIFEMCNVLKLKQIKYKEVHTVRWLSLFEAVKAVQCTLPALIVYFCKEATENAQAKINYKSIKSFNFLAGIHFMLDVLNVITTLSKQFQSKTLELSDVVPLIKNTIMIIETWESDVSGSQLTAFLSSCDDHSTDLTHFNFYGTSITRKPDFNEHKVTFVNK